MIMYPEQCRGARAMLGWSRERLAKSSNVSIRTIVDFERGARKPYDRTLIDVRKAFEDAGISFIDKNGEGPGVQLRKRGEN